MSKFKIGDRVRHIRNPDYVGNVVAVESYDACTINFDFCGFLWYEDRYVELVPRETLALDVWHPMSAAPDGVLNLFHPEPWPSDLDYKQSHCEGNATHFMLFKREPVIDIYEYVISMGYGEAYKVTVVRIDGVIQPTANVEVV